MKILMIPSRMLPIPPVKGGAVQNLINFYIEWNEKEKNNDLIVTSIYNEDAKNLSSELKILLLHTQEDIDSLLNSCTKISLK